MTDIRKGIPIAAEPVEDGINLDIGCGEAPIDGFIHLDMRALPGVDMVLDLTRPLPYQPETVDVVYSSHFLEHISQVDLPQVLANWRTVLKPKGIVEIHVPDLLAIAVDLSDPLIKDNRQAQEDFLPHIYGGHRHSTDDHVTGFTFLILEDLLKTAGFMYVEHAGNPIDRYDLTVLAYK